MSVCEEREEEKTACKMSVSEEREEEMISCKMSVSEEREEEKTACKMSVSEEREKEASPEFSCVSMKSNNSIGLPPDLSDGPAVTSDSVRKRKRAASPISSCVSMKSNNSIGLPPNLSDGPAVTSDPVVDHGEFMISRLHKYAVDLTLDPNTAHTHLVLSEENRKVTCVRESQSYPDHPDRFDVWHQVLCGESLTGRCYWEAEWSGDYTYISVSYKGIKRKGRWSDCWFGWNEKSWNLSRYNHSLSVWHNSKFTAVSADSGSCKRVGVFVDVSAGTLSFYSVSDTHTLTHLHTFTHTFTEPLYAGFRLPYSNSSVSLCHIKHTHTNTH